MFPQASHVSATVVTQRGQLRRGEKMSAFSKYNEAIKSEYSIPEFEVASPFFKLAFDVEVETGQLRADNSALREAVEQAREFVDFCARKAYYIPDRDGAIAWLAAHPAEVKA
jgi:hypothetical protein